MHLSDYQEKAKSTAIYPNQGENIYYPALGLAGETGEVLNKIKKVMRDHEGVVNDEYKQILKKELGDVLWYVAGLCTELDLDMAEVAEENINKLFSRKERGKLQGDGDNR
jgi:NTP pyrophosphatase (non-canonical NTP hydrolase)